MREWFGGLSRVLFVHAHPDDETITTGGTLAALAAAGREPMVVTLTRGERGEVTAGPFTHLSGAALAAHRETELAAALAMLGVQHHAFLGTPPARAAGLPQRTYEDSGMRWGADGMAEAAPDAPAAALTRANAVDPLTDLIALADAWDARAIVSYDETGGYGHPDHVFAHRAARSVAAGLDVPFWEIVPTLSGVAAGVAGATDAAGAADSANGADFERHDVTEWLDRKTAALRAHGTQLSVSGGEIVHVGGQRQPIDKLELFRPRRLE